MLQFAWRVQRVDIHHHIARTQGTENTDRILQHIRHHQGHAGPQRQLENRLQVSGKIPRQLVELRVGDLDPHVDIGHAVAILCDAFLEQLAKRLELAQINLGGYALLIALQPDLLHLLSS
jgi:hypothetical protein